MNEHVRDKIKERLSERNVSQSEMARAIGLKPPHVTRYLRGEVGSLTDNWQKMLTFTDLDIFAADKQLLTTEEDEQLELTAINPKLLGFIEQLTTLHGEEWLLDRLEVLAALEDGSTERMV